MSDDKLRERAQQWLDAWDIDIHSGATDSLHHLLSHVEAQALERAANIADNPKPGWNLTHWSGLLEIHWKRGPKGLYADRIRIAGSDFHYISGKKANLRP